MERKEGQGTELCAEGVGSACEEGREKQAAQAGHMEEKLRKGACGFDVGGCRATVAL